MFALGDSILASQLQRSSASAFQRHLDSERATMTSLATLAKTVPFVFESRRANDADLRKALLSYCIKKVYPEFQYVPEVSDGDSYKMENHKRCRKAIIDVVAEALKEGADSPPNKRRKLPEASLKASIASDDQVQKSIEIVTKWYAAIFDTLKREEPLAFDIQVAHLQENGRTSAQLSSLQDEIEHLRDQLHATDRKLARHEKEAAANKADGEMLVRLVRQHTVCRNMNCRGSMFAVDVKPSGLIAGLRCSQCGAKHSRTYVS